MEKNQNKKIGQYLKKFFKERKITQNTLSKQLNYSDRSALSKIYSGDNKLTESTARMLKSLYPELDLNFLLGDSHSFKSDSNVIKEDKAVYEAIKSEPLTGIPLMPISAVGGFVGNSFDVVVKNNVTDWYSIPEFKDRNVDYLIPMQGNSMNDTYCNGERLACRYIEEQLFIQWNEVHVIDSKSQGPIVKRIRPSEDEECIICISDNPEYHPFTIPSDDIRSLSIVLGAISIK